MKLCDKIVNTVSAKLAAMVPQSFIDKLNKDGRLVAAMAKAEPELKAMAPEVVAMLQKALASEWIAYYQYWLGSLVARGCQRAAIAEELADHAAEEFAHAERIAARIVELGGLPQPAPADWDAMSPAKYAAPVNQDATAIVAQNHESEKLAISFYEAILAMTKGADEVTYDIVLKIIEEEHEHESDLRKFLEDAVAWAAGRTPKLSASAQISELQAALDAEKLKASAAEGELLAAKATSAELSAKLAKAFTVPQITAKGVPAKPSAVPNHL